jgi:hypothetical protein
MARRWVGPLVALALGVLAGWLFGRSIAQSIANNPGGPVPDLPRGVGLLVVGGVAIVLLVLAGLLLLSRRRRPISAALLAAAAGWVGAYLVALSLGYPWP